MVISERTSSLWAALTPFTIAPGSIFKAPVPFVMPFPTPFAHRKDNSAPLTPTDAVRVSVGNEWLDEASGQYRSQNVREIINQAKVRPFLLARPLRDCRESCYLGLSITSIKPEHRQNASFYQNMRRNQLPNFFYLPAEPDKLREMGLDKESSVYLAKPTVIPEKFLTHYLGCVPDNLFNEIWVKTLMFLVG